MGRSTRAGASLLLPSVLVDRSIAAANDDLRVMPLLVRRLLDERAEPGGATRWRRQPLSIWPVRGSSAIRTLHQRRSSVARDYIALLLADLRGRGATLVELDGEQVVFGVAPCLDFGERGISV